MAEIDARIPLMAQQAKIPDLTEMYGNAANMANLMQQTQLNRLNYQGTMALNQALQDQSNIDPTTGAPDVGKVLGGVAGQGFGAAPAVLAYGKNATDIAKTRAETGLATANIQKSLADAHTARLDAQGKLMGIEGQLLSGVNDQASYDKVIQMARNVDPNGFSDAPAQYDPAYVQKRMQQAVSVGDQIKNQLEQYKNVSGRISAQASASQAGTAAGRLGLDTLLGQNTLVTTPTGVVSVNRVQGGPGQTVAAFNPQTVESLKTAGAEYGKALKGYQDQAVQTGTDLNQLRQLESLSKSADLGPGAHGIGALRNLAGTYLGDTDTSKMTANAQIDQIANRLILNARNNPDTRVAGAFTKAQQDLEAAAQIERTNPRAAFQAKVQALMDLRERESKVANDAVDYADKHGGVLDNNFFQQAAQTTRQPLYSGQQRPPLSSFHIGGQ